MNIYWLEFKYPYIFILLLLIPVIIYFELKNKDRGVKFSPILILKKVYGISSIWLYIKTSLLVVTYTCFIFILANPGSTNTKSEETRKGIDIAFVFDISKSMLAEDISPNRIEAAKQVMEDFLKNLKNDMISITIFAGKPFVSIPLTFDYESVRKYIETITTQSINQEMPGLSGTAIGDGLIAATDGLIGKNEDKKREKVIILITDGEANVGINPKIALKYVNNKKVKIYTIGIGSESGTELFMTDNFGNKQYFVDVNGVPIKAKLDEEMLKYLADNTGGKYFNAQSSNSLKKIFEELSKLNKTEAKINIIRLFNQKYYYFVLIIFLSIIPLVIIENKYKL